MFQWSEKYSVGVESIDKQHREIITSLGSLLEAMKQGRANEITPQTLLALEKYASLHFQKEEYFFERFNYPDKAKHIGEHRYFTQKIAQLKTDLSSGKITITFELLSFMKDWIEHHILVEDKKYMECFHQNGLK
jgi:hemerythrin-like metal-binding protein